MIDVFEFVTTNGVGTAELERLLADATQQLSQHELLASMGSERAQLEAAAAAVPLRANLCRTLHTFCAAD